MPYDQTSPADVELIIITDDLAHAQCTRESLSSGRYRYSVTHISERAQIHADFDTAVEAVRGKRPVIVFLDCTFLKGQSETLAARVLELRSVMAIECVVTRPPEEHHRRVCLRMLGASLVDDGARTTAIVPLH